MAHGQPKPGATSHRIISSDAHVIEPPDLWTDRVPREYRERAPRLVREGDYDFWYCDGLRGMDVATGTQTGLRFEKPELLTRRDRFENVRPGGYIPEAHVKDMDLDGVDVNILYPTAGFGLFWVPDGKLLDVLFRAYNDWVAEFCGHAPRRLKAVGMINLDDVAEGIQELERCAKLGLVGGMITLYPPDDRSYDSPMYEPFWSAAEALGMPLSLHVSTQRQRPSGVDTKAASMPNLDRWVRISLAHMVLSGVFERHPRLQVGSVEMELAWAAHFIERLDYTYTQRARREEWHRYKEDMLPSDYFHRNVFLSFQQDALGVRLRDVIGVDNLQWGSDYPHQESTFPRTRQILDRMLAECTAEERRKMVGGNAARVFRLG